MSLKKYRAKRDLKKSKEPSAKKQFRKESKLHFVVQKHAATRLHYDFRLEVKGVLKSWAVPKGPSLNPKDKRLAIMVEDHPFAYKDFEGIIPEGYGAGSVIIWDQGTYAVDQMSADESEDLVIAGIKKGEFHFTLEGKKLKGIYTLIRIQDEKNQWLLIKKKDAFASTQDILQMDRSVISDVSLEELKGKQDSPLDNNFKKKAPKRKMPHHVKPMFATLIDAPFDHADWIFEIKWDGFRALAEVSHSDVSLYSRNFLSLNEKFPHIVEHLKQLNIEAIFDGEIVALDSKGIPRFQLLQNIQSQPEEIKNLWYCIFDLLYLDGHDLSSLPLLERKQLLRKILEHAQDSFLHYVDHIEEQGNHFFQACIQNDLEGIIGKKKDSLYAKGKRTKDWIKVKRHLKQEVVICGFTEPKGSRKELGALIIGIYHNDVLTFCGHVGGGFTEKKLKEVKAILIPLIQKKSPFKSVPKTHKPVTWVKPYLLCEVVFNEWTSDGIMRQPIFLGLREDKKPKEVKKEKPQKKEELLKIPQDESSQKAILTHLTKIYWPKEKITKGDCVQYYERMAQTILPYLKNRPESLKRFPEGIEKPNFFQKNMKTYPEWIQTVKIPHKEKIVNYLLIQDLDSLLYAANLGCIELHPFFSRIESLNFPDFLVFDLDPEEISFDKVVTVATALHEVLEELACPSYCKTSGATGLHICVPLQAKYTYDQAKTFAKIIAMITHKRTSQISSLERSPKNRRKKVYIDYLQNNPGQTIVAPYSLRARPKAPVSAPLDWSEVTVGLNPLDFNIKSMPKRIQRVGDLFKPVLQKGISLEKILKKIEKF